MLPLWADLVVQGGLVLLFWGEILGLGGLDDGLRGAGLLGFTESIWVVNTCELKLVELVTHDKLKVEWLVVLNQLRDPRKFSIKRLFVGTKLVVFNKLL